MVYFNAWKVKDPTLLSYAKATVHMEMGSILQLVGILLLFTTLVLAKDVHHHDFVIKETSYTRLCQTKKILTVNGQFPGPTIKARKGDTIIITAYNQAHYNITLHWHGVNQPRNPWFDGTEYVTQCPIQPGANFTYKMLLSEEEGTLWWHAHSDWSRATVHGAIIIYPKLGTTFPFPRPYKEFPIILGEWWNDDISRILGDLLRTGGDAPDSDAYTINGQPGDLYPCSRKDAFKVNVEHGKTYLFRVINAALITELFFAIAGHQLTVVGTDASYTKPLIVDYIMITPGQTMDIILKAKPIVQNTRISRYYMAARAYCGDLVAQFVSTSIKISFSNTTTTAILQYKTTSKAATKHPLLPTLPNFHDNRAANEFMASLRSLASKDHPIDVPKFVDEQLIITIALNIICPNTSCIGLPGKELRVSSSLNNISFEQSPVNILGAYYNAAKGVFGTDFPDRPPVQFNFTGDNLPPNLLTSTKEMEVKMLEYGSNIEVVFQGTTIITGENHPMHLHGHSVYVVGSGTGNFDAEKDPLTYNLVDPPYQNTVAVPKNGWSAIRFQAKNPGVWFMHCHLERHQTWGMNTVFIVKNGESTEAQLLPPPPNMPSC